MFSFIKITKRNSSLVKWEFSTTMQPRSFFFNGYKIQVRPATYNFLMHSYCIPCTDILFILSFIDVLLAREYQLHCSKILEGARRERLLLNMKLDLSALFCGKQFVLYWRMLSQFLYYQIIFRGMFEIRFDSHTIHLNPSKFCDFFECITNSNGN